MHYGIYYISNSSTTGRIYKWMSLCGKPEEDSSEPFTVHENAVTCDACILLRLTDEKVSHD